MCVTLVGILCADKGACCSLAEQDGEDSGKGVVVAAHCGDRAFGVEALDGGGRPACVACCVA